MTSRSLVVIGHVCLTPSAQAAHRHSPETADCVWVFACQHVVIHLDNPAIPADPADPAMTLIKIAVGELLAILVVHAVDAETIERIADQPVVFSFCFYASTRAVVMVFPHVLGMSAAMVLHLVSDCIAPGIIQRIEKRHAVQHHPDHPGKQPDSATTVGESDNARVIVWAVIALGLRTI